MRIVKLPRFRPRIPLPRLPWRVRRVVQQGNVTIIHVSAPPPSVAVVSRLAGLAHGYVKCVKTQTGEVCYYCGQRGGREVCFPVDPSSVPYH